LKWARTAFFVLAAACLAQAAVMYSRLPPLVASHFGPSGAANGWMSRDLFIGIYVFIVLFLGVMMSRTVFGLPGRSQARVNLPHKDYWLAPERREQTFAWLQAFLLWSGAGTFVLLLDMFHQVFRFNLGLAARLEHPLMDIALYGAYTAAWIVALLRRFSSVPADA
jgi:hypothetical protein